MPTTSTATAVGKMPMRAGGPPLGNVTANQRKVPTHSISTSVARVAPLQQQHAQHQQQPQLSQGQPQGQQAQSQPATPTSSAVHRTSHNNYEIQTLHVLQNRSGQQIAEKDSNSAKMLVLLVSGEERLITFALPRESCTVQDLLEQIGVPFDSTTTIQCIENPGANIDFVVTVGFSEQQSASELISRAEQNLQMRRQQESGMATSTTAAQQQQQLVHTQQQQRVHQVGGTPRFRSPPMATVAQAQQLQSSPSLNSSKSSISTPVARVAPLQQQQAQHQQQPQLSQGQQAQSQPATPTSSAVPQTSHNNYEIQTLHVLQNRSGQQIAEKDSNSAKMLVVLVSGEQRLITFTLPRESCTVQDLLEQVGVPFDSTTTIQCVENPGANIEFVVTVGFSEQQSASELISRAEQNLQMRRQQESGMATSTVAAIASTTASRAQIYRWFHNRYESR